MEKEEKKHALLSPSAAHRWINCTAAPRLEEHMPDEGSDYAKEGSLAHALCALHLKSYLGQSPEETKGELSEIIELSSYGSGEMAEYAEAYCNIVKEKYAEAKSRTKDAILLVEVRLDFTQYIPEAFGTADAVIIADGTMEVIDFKYGKGVRVSAELNPQMMIYALGAFDFFGFEYDIEKVKMTIVQPRIDNLSEYTIEVGDLLKWAAQTLVPKAQDAYAGGTAHPGSWCQFCKAKYRCKAMVDLVFDTVEASEDCKKDQLNDAESKLIDEKTMAEKILPNIPIIKNWLAGIEEFALRQALSGVRYDGYKIVEGRSVRKITDPEGVMTALGDAGYDPAAYMRKPELVTLTELEKLVGKKKFATLCGSCITKPAGKPTLVPESDKRAAIDPAAQDLEGIE